MPDANLRSEMSQNTQTKGEKSSSQFADSKRLDDGRASPVLATSVATDAAQAMFDAALAARRVREAADATPISDTAVDQQSSSAERDRRREFVDRVACAQRHFPTIAEQMRDDEAADYITIDVDSGEYVVAPTRGASVDAFLKRFGDTRRRLTAHVGSILI